MLEENETSKKLWVIIKSKHSELDDIGIQKIVDNLMRYAFFVVRRWAKEHDRTAKNNPGNGLGGKTRDPPS